MQFSKIRNFNFLEELLPVLTSIDFSVSYEYCSLKILL